MIWRPDGWPERSVDKVNGITDDGAWNMVYEAGADAMYPFAHEKGQKDLAKDVIDFLDTQDDCNLSLWDGARRLERWLKGKGLLE